MPRQRLRLNPNEARDSGGLIHRAVYIDSAGLYMQAACDNRLRVGTNPDRLTGYCPHCFPDYIEPMPDLPSLDLDGNKDLGNIIGALKIKYSNTHPPRQVEEITVNSWDIQKPKLDPTKVIEQILRKRSGFTRRTLHNFNYYGTKLKDS